LKLEITQLFEKDVISSLNCHSWCCVIYSFQMLGCLLSLCCSGLHHLELLRQTQ